MVPKEGPKTGPKGGPKTGPKGGPKTKRRFSRDASWITSWLDAAFPGYHACQYPVLGTLPGLPCPVYCPDYPALLYTCPAHRHVAPGSTGCTQGRMVPGAVMRLYPPWSLVILAS